MKCRMTRKHRVVKYWLPVFLGMALIFLLSTEVFSSAHTSRAARTVLSFLIPGISAGELGWINFHIRKAAHVVEYFILGLLLFRAFRAGSKASFHWRWSFLAFIGVVLWAAGDEFHQFFAPTRSASPMDVGIDTAGGMLAQFASALYYLFVKSLNFLKKIQALS